MTIGDWFFIAIYACGMLAGGSIVALYHQVRAILASWADEQSEALNRPARPDTIHVIMRSPVAPVPDGNGDALSQINRGKRG